MGIADVGTTRDSLASAGQKTPILTVRAEAGDHKVSFLPHYDDGNGWYNILPPPSPARELRGDEIVDWLVVGAGYTGLSTARRLAEHYPADRIALIEADRVGRGASGRNAGFAIDLPFIREAHGDVEHGRRLLKLHRAGVAELERLVEEHAIACQWSHRGKYMVAVADRACRALDETRIFLDKIGEASEVLGRAALKERLGTDFYRMALFSPGTRLMNPAALTRGLAASLPPNVELYENSPITAIRFGDENFAWTAKGTVRSPHTILATNGFTEAFGVMHRRTFNIMTFASLTHPLVDEAQNGLLGSTPDWGIHPVGPSGATIRCTQDNRIWYRTGFIYAPTIRSNAKTLARFRERHTEEYKRRFPQVGDPRFEHTYGGGLCVSRNAEPIFQKLANNIFVAACQNGTGVAKGTIHGRLIADWAAGVESELLRYTRAYGAPCRIPADPFLGWGVRLRLALESWQGRME
jgi:glycine/D-amino acid oxidase-like deaminating enzyme